jgi:hypothetical protein
MLTSGALSLLTFAFVFARAGAGAEFYPLTIVLRVQQDHEPHTRGNSKKKQKHRGKIWDANISEFSICQVVVVEFCAGNILGRLHGSPYAASSSWLTICCVSSWLTICCFIIMAHHMLLHHHGSPYAAYHHGSPYAASSSWLTICCVSSWLTICCAGGDGNKLKSRVIKRVDYTGDAGFSTKVSR